MPLRKPLPLTMNVVDIKKHLKFAQGEASLSSGAWHTERVLLCWHLFLMVVPFSTGGFIRVLSLAELVSSVSLSIIL